MKNLAKKVHVFPLLSTSQNVELDGEVVQSFSPPFLCSSEDQWKEIDLFLKGHPSVRISLLGFYCPYSLDKKESPYVECFSVFDNARSARDFVAVSCDQRGFFDLSSFEKKKSPFAQISIDHQGGSSDV